jgi:signal transduction histidine kinase
MAAKKGVTLSLHAGEDPAVAQVDAAQIQQVFANILVNAVQAVPDRGTVDVTVARERTTPPPDHGGPRSDYVCARVRDDGHGIAPDHLPHVFEPFFTTKDVGQGTGLGLSVAYGIVREHGGWIAARSEPGRGAEFSVYLPVGAPS